MKMSIENQDKILAKAQKIMEHRASYGKGLFFESPEAVKKYLLLRHQGKEAEQFDVIFMDNRHRLIECVTMFQGTIDSAAVYPREVAKKALELNAAAIILAHNHPSGVAEPSRADIDITGKLVRALGLIDVRILDHVITGNNFAVSLKERGEM